MYKFHSDWFGLSAASFRGAVKDRYPNIKKKELDALVDKYYPLEVNDELDPIQTEFSEDIE